MYPQNIMIWELILKFLQMILKFYLTQYGLSLHTKIYKPDMLASPNASHVRNSTYNSWNSLQSLNIKHVTNTTFIPPVTLSSTDSQSNYIKSTFICI